MKAKYLIGIVFLLHIVLALYHLNHTKMWDDEASVVWFAKNYNTYGKIIGFDGTNIFSYRNGQLINDQLGYNNPPMDIYYAAWVMRHFGASDAILRFSFLILGIIALGFFIASFYELTQGDSVWWLIGSVLLLLSINYLLIASNVRYYALVFLFGAISLWAHLKILKVAASKVLVKCLYLLLGLVAIYCFFLSHFLAALCWWFVLFVILWQQAALSFLKRGTFFWYYILFNSLLAIVIFQYIIKEQVLHRPDLDGSDSFFHQYSKLLEWLFWDLHYINILPLFVTPLLVYLFIFKSKILSPAFKNLVLYTGIFLALIVVLDPQPTSASHSFDIRYLYIVIPFLYLLMAYLFKLIYIQSDKAKWLSIALIFIFINTNLLTVLPSDTGPRWLLPNYVKEASQPYPTAYSVALEYIDKHFDTKQKVLSLPGYHNTVFLRYVPDKIEITNTLWPNTKLSKTLVDSLGMDCLYVGHCKPDYIFQFGQSENLEAYPFKKEDYKYVDTLMVYAHGVDVSRPELYWHSFGPRAIKDKNVEALYIYHD